jgi:hypothetical protein
MCAIDEVFVKNPTPILVVFRRHKALEAQRTKCLVLIIIVSRASENEHKRDTRQSSAEESHSKKDRKKLQQHMRQPWSDKSNYIKRSGVIHCFGRVQSHVPSPHGAGQARMTQAPHQATTLARGHRHPTAPSRDKRTGLTRQTTHRHKRPSASSKARNSSRRTTAFSIRHGWKTCDPPTRIPHSMRRFRLRRAYERIGSQSCQGGLIPDRRGLKKRATSEQELSSSWRARLPTCKTQESPHHKTSNNQQDNVSPCKGERGIGGEEGSPHGVQCKNRRSISLTFCLQTGDQRHKHATPGEVTI